MVFSLGFLIGRPDRISAHNNIYRPILLTYLTQT